MLNIIGTLPRANKSLRFIFFIKHPAFQIPNKVKQGQTLIVAFIFFHEVFLLLNKVKQLLLRFTFFHEAFSFMKR